MLWLRTHRLVHSDTLASGAHSTEGQANRLLMFTDMHTALKEDNLPASNGLIKAGSRTLPGPSIPLDKFVLEPEEVTALQKRLDVSIEELMQLLVAPASLLARAPTSDFPVGCDFALCVNTYTYAVVCTRRNVPSGGCTVSHINQPVSIIRTSGQEGLQRRPLYAGVS